MTEEEYVVFIQPYEDALKNIRVRVEVLNDDYRRKYQNYPIHHVQDRIKKKESIEQKLARRGCECDVESARDCLTDISGIRVICYFVRDIYAVVSLLKKQTDIVVIKECDYISHPKHQGLHPESQVQRLQKLSHRVWRPRLSHGRHGVLSCGDSASNHVHGLVGEYGAPHLL